MRTANPALNRNTFQQVGRALGAERGMTLDGTVNKSGFLIILTILSAGWIWMKFFSGIGGAVVPGSGTVDADALARVAGMAKTYTMIGAFGGLIFALVTIFKKTWAGFTAPCYALLEGLFLGAFSAMMEFRFPGIVIQAIGLTFGTFICLLLAYKSRLIRATENFKLGVVAATGGIFVVYMATWLLGMFGVGIPYIHGSGVLGIGFSAFVVVIAAMNLVLDFDFIEQGCEQGAPKYMEWYAAFGLLVTLVWLYLEILRLLAKLRSRD